ncbi:MAG: hypothetical protein BWK76_05660 [Desulfobulbaceae bacterium A2]|nr:MAG: hypothetical protein BWK76_05660 [Desulfobulbaceae bacterium A2]
MLHILRRRAQSKIIQLMVLLIAIVFIFWGVGSNYLSDRNAAVTVNSEEIPLQEYQRAYDRATEGLREQFGGVLPDKFHEMVNLKQQVLSQLVRSALLRQGGQTMGLQISPEMIRQEISTMAAFQDQGRFDLTRYRQLLAQNHFSPATFEAQLRDDMVRSASLKAIQRFARIPDDEVAQYTALAGEEIRLLSCSIGVEAFRDRVQPSDDDLTRFFAQKREDYRPGPQVKLQYLLFATADDLAAIDVTEDEIAARFTESAQRFSRPETRRARHILLRSGADPVALRSQAEQILQQLKAGADFVELAQKHSQDSGSAPRGGDLGPFSRGSMVPSFEDAVFALKPGELSGIVETDFGLHIIKLEEIQPAQEQTLDQVHGQLAQEIRQERAAQQTMARAAAAYEEVIRAGSMSAYATQWQGSLRETDYFDREHPPEKFMQDGRFLDSTFRLQSGELSSLTEIASGYVLMFAQDLRRPEAPALEVVHDKVRRDFIRQETRNLVRNMATELLDKARAGGDLTEPAKQLGLHAVTSGAITHDPANQAASGLPPALLREAFKLSGAQPFPAEVFESGEAYFVFQLLERHSREQNLDGKKREQLRDRLLDGRQEALVSSWLSTLEAQSKILTNKQLLR